ncbi:MAG: acyl-CoA thioesterase [Leptospira sp.]|nr:acyl-CoA thioesterase [Leptospira sp.]
MFLKEEKVKFAHCDPAGIVFYPRYMEMLNELVEDWFEEALGLPFKDMHKGEGMPTIDLKVQFKSPSRLGDLLLKSLWVKNIGKSSVTYGFDFKNNEKIAVIGEATLVYVDNDGDGKIFSKPWSDTLRAKLEKYVNH